MKLSEKITMLVQTSEFTDAKSIQKSVLDIYGINLTLKEIKIVQRTVEKFQLIVGQQINFKNERPSYKVMAVSKRYLVCSRKLSRKHDAELLKHRVEMNAYLTFTQAYNSLKESPVYSIVDLFRQVRSSNDLVFNSYDYFDSVDCWITIVELMDGKMQLSTRNQTELEFDFERFEK